MDATSKKFSGAPFGVATTRFVNAGIHPRRQIPGLSQTVGQDKGSALISTQKPGHGAYVTKEQNVISDQRQMPGIDWARQLETERLASQPHLLYKEKWEQNQMLKRKLGPGSYEIKDFIQLANEKLKHGRGLYDNTAPRFQTSKQGSVPGPGAYGANGIPQKVLEDKAKRSFSSKGMLECGGRDQMTTSVGSGLGPGTYNVKSGTDELLNKVTGLKGPYSLFSGDRNKPNTEGHFAILRPSQIGPGQYNIKSFVDDLNEPHRKYQGRFSKLEQYPEVPTDRIFLYSKMHHPKMKESLGPGAYDIKEFSKPSSQKHPGFLSSSRRDDKMAQKFFTRNFNPVGPGRYDIQKFEEAQDVNGHRSVFKSKTGKLSAQLSKVLQERIQGNISNVDANILPFMQKAAPRPLTVM